MPEDFRINPEITRCRKKLDAIDKKILKLYKQRFKVIRRLANIKLFNDMPIENPDREEVVFKKWKKIFKSAKVDPEFLEALFALTLESSKREQEQYYEKHT